jgi:hypothetical protein
MRQKILILKLLAMIASKKFGQDRDNNPHALEE